VWKREKEGGELVMVAWITDAGMLAVGNFKPEQVCHYLAASSKTMAKSLLHLV